MKQTNYSETTEVIRHLIAKNYSTLTNLDAQLVDTLLDYVDNGFCLISWPESQDYMEKSWFKDEAIFCGGSEDQTGSSAYFIPIKRLIEND